MPSKDELKSLFRRLRGQSRTADVIESRDLPVHPKLSGPLMSASLRSAADVKGALTALCDPIDAATINAESRHAARTITVDHFDRSNDVTDPCKLYKWCAGQKGYARCKDASLQADLDLCMKNIARWFAELTGDDVAVVLQRHNFFHGHLILFPDPVYTERTSPELFMLFHAMEYPEDLEAFKAKCARAVIGPGDYRGFSATDRKYRCRNALWSFTLGKVWFFNFASPGHPYQALLDDPDLSQRSNPTTIGQDTLGCERGNVFAHINYFPGEWAGAGEPRSFWCIT
jgi:hypothetical protein